MDADWFCNTIFQIIWLLNIEKYNPTCSLIGVFALCYYVIL